MEIEAEVKLVKCVKAECRVEIEADTPAEVKQVSRLISRLWSKLIFELRKYKLNYLFKYSKSMVESGSIIIMLPT